MNSPTLDLTRQLIERPSVTPEDAGCLTLIGERLRSAGFVLHPLQFGEVENLWAVRGDSGPLLCFAGHTDVVPPGPLEKWQSPPFDPSLRGGLLHGRGAADMKGSLAAMVTAAERAQPSPGGRLAFLLTSDEEGIAVDGTVRVIEWLAQRGEHIDWCVVGEPSSSEALGDTIKNGRRGSLNCRLVVHGVQGHVAYPARATNPVHRLAPALTELSTRQWDAGNDFFPATSFQVSNIHAGTGATNVIPGELELVFNFRFCTESTAAALQRETESILQRHGLDFSAEWNLSGEPFLTASGALVDAALEAVNSVTGITPNLSTAGGTSDGRFIAPTGAEVVELGPVNATIHQIDECVRADDLDRLSHIYQAIIERLLPV